MKAQEIRKIFLDYFKNKEHKIVPSAPLVIKNDPTLMFTNAGMNQFKDYFLGTKNPPFQRVADTQKCLRVSGKHNDLEEVGIDTYHHTMFEMLGNWSFGDYFKEEAIQWAWELLTKGYGLQADRLYATVFGGDKKEKLEADTEARGVWERILPQKKVLDGSKKDNFWEMGETGPCGPCSEIHIDLRSEKEREKVDGRDLVNKNHPEVIEIWNLVFIQFNRKSDGELEDLPAKHVDTGMGFERLVMAIQKKLSNYDTDVFTELIQQVETLASVRYGSNKTMDVAIRVVVDHVRAVSFAIADGQLPSNTGAGYVIRRILRRAVRYGFQFLKLNKPILASLVPSLAKQFKDVFPDLTDQQDFICKVVSEEETNFLRTLEEGLKQLEQIQVELQKKQSDTISGRQAFELYDTFGFPLDLTLLIAREHKLHVDKKAFEKEMQKQKERSKEDAVKELSDWTIVRQEEGEGFIGYDQTSSDVLIDRYRLVKTKDKTHVQMVLNRTPFYAESGGQVGDTGVLFNKEQKIRVLDTKKENELIVHWVDGLPKRTDQIFHAEVDINKRQMTMNNHSATHLLHAALRKVLGSHVEQRGSLVNEKTLRFDFSHFAKMTPSEIEQVEDMVNEKVRENVKLIERRNVPINIAKKEGAMALFGEKYGEYVRMIIFDPEYSVELCGGTHVPATGHIGLFKIVSESSIAAGIRRIEAVTAKAAEQYVRDQALILREIADQLKQPKDLLQSVKVLFKEKSALEKEISQLMRDKIKNLKSHLKSEITEHNGMNLLVQRVDLPDMKAMKQLAFELRKESSRLLMVFGSVIKDKPILAVAITDDLVSEHHLHAGEMVSKLAHYIKGGGGGQPFFATAGGSEVRGLDEALKQVNQLIN